MTKTKFPLACELSCNLTLFQIIHELHSFSSSKGKTHYTGCFLDPMPWSFVSLDLICYIPAKCFSLKDTANIMCHPAMIWQYCWVMKHFWQKSLRMSVSWRKICYLPMTCLHCICQSAFGFGLVLGWWEPSLLTMVTIYAPYCLSINTNRTEK